MQDAAVASLIYLVNGLNKDSRDKKIREIVEWINKSDYAKQSVKIFENLKALEVRSICYGLISMLGLIQQVSVLVCKS